METKMNQKDITIISNAVVLANAAELASSILLKIAGNDISNSINGSTVNKTILSSLVQNRILQKLEERSCS